MIDNLELNLSDWQKIDELFGLRLIADTPNVDIEVYDLIEERDVARKNKDFGRSDEIRNELLRRGIALNDTPNGAVWYYN